MIISDIPVVSNYFRNCLIAQVLRYYDGRLESR